jgi:X-X-X-Leu-X-X-Gly heptad repeat protein
MVFLIPQMASGTRQMASGTRQMASGTKQKASGTQQIASGVRQMLKTTFHVNGKSFQAAPHSRHDAYAETYQPVVLW